MRKGGRGSREVEGKDKSIKEMHSTPMRPKENTIIMNKKPDTSNQDGETTNKYKKHISYGVYMIANT